MKERFTNIVARSRQRKFIIALCFIIVIAAIWGTVITHRLSRNIANIIATSELSDITLEGVKPVDTSEFGSLSIGAVLPKLDYASRKMVIFHGYFGLFVYDIENKELYRSIDLKTIDSNYMQGSIYTKVSVTKDGKTIYIDNIGDGYDDFMYEYHVDENKLTRTRVKNVSNSYVVGDISEKISDTNGIWVSAQYAQIEEDSYVCLLSDSLIVGDLKLGVYNEKDHSSQNYSIFDSSATNSNGI